MSDRAIRYAYDHSNLEEMTQKYREMFGFQRNNHRMLEIHAEEKWKMSLFVNFYDRNLQRIALQYISGRFIVISLLIFTKFHNCGLISS